MMWAMIEGVETMWNVHVTVNMPDCEFDFEKTLYSEDELSTLVSAMQTSYPSATSLVIALVFNPRAGTGSARHNSAAIPA